MRGRSRSKVGVGWVKGGGGDTRLKVGEEILGGDGVPGPRWTPPLANRA